MTKTFVVAGDHGSLLPDDVVAVFPPDGSLVRTRPGVGRSRTSMPSGSTTPGRTISTAGTRSPYACRNDAESALRRRKGFPRRG